MAFEEVMNAMRESMQDSLDELASPRLSSKSKTKALQNLERHLAMACCSTQNESEARDSFLALQSTFECNVPSHLLSWITLSTLRLDSITSKVSADVDERAADVDELVSQLTLSLSLLQGVILNHEPSKRYSGRRRGLEVLLDLLLISRYLSAPSSNAELSSKSPTTSPHLTSIVLDTLLCILVDSCAALRTFEEASGVQAVVKILKRAGTPREVRMKCLEFLYFYLLDETPSSNSASALKSTQPTPPSTAPATPIRPPKPYLSGTPMRPTSRYGSSTLYFSSSTTAGLSLSGSSGSSRSTSASSAKSFASTSSNASSSTTASSISTSPVKESEQLMSPIKALPKSPIKRITTPQTQQQQHRTPPNSPPLASSARLPQLRSMMMLRKEVDYVPQSPKKIPGLSSGRPTHRKSLSASTSFHSRSWSQVILPGSQNEDGDKSSGINVSIASPLSPDKLEKSAGIREPSSSESRNKEEGKWKTTEEKKELLGTMLGNVDALVEGVRKAGIWGLG